jgi:hypothetical protein
MACRSVRSAAGPVFPSMFTGAAIGIAVSGLPGMDLGLPSGWASMRRATHKYHRQPEDLDPDFYVVLGDAVGPALASGAELVELGYVGRSSHRPSGFPSRWTMRRSSSMSTPGCQRRHRSGGRDERSEDGRDDEVAAGAVGGVFQGGGDRLAVRSDGRIRS